MTIDTCYEGIIKQLTDAGKILSISQKLSSLRTNDEIVRYIYDIIESLKAFPKLLEVKKSENVSTYYRNLGNECFQKLKDYEAWQYYNLSLLHAPQGSDCYTIALANRSAIFAFLKKFKNCLVDIEKVFSNKYPDNLKEKLTKRQELCKNALTKQKIIKEDPKIGSLLSLQGSRNANYLCASSKIEVKFNKEMGRHVLARENIKVGEVIAVENPYFTLLLKSQYLFRCSYCISQNDNIYPCDGCCFAMYCSKECRNLAWESYHSVECPLMATLVDLDFTKLELLALRTTIKARTDHTNWTDLFKTIEEAESQMDTENHGLVEIDGQWIYDSKYYTSIHTLASNFEKRSMSDIFQKSVTAAVFLKFLTENTNFLKSDNINEAKRIKECVAGTLLLHGMTSPTNMHNIGSNVQSANGDFLEEINIGSAPYAFLSLLNHSCSPNVVRFSKLGTGEMTLFALRPIKKGMQLYDNYGPHHAMEECFLRQNSLKFQYKFACACEACVNDWPNYFSLKSTNLPTVQSTKKKLLNAVAMEKLQKGDKDTALKIFGGLCELLDVLDKYAPCQEMADCQEALKQCLIILQGLVPYGYNRYIEWSVKPLVV